MNRDKFDIDGMSKRAEDALENHATNSNPTRSAGAEAATTDQRSSASQILEE